MTVPARNCEIPCLNLTGVMLRPRAWAGAALGHRPGADAKAKTTGSTPRLVRALGRHVPRLRDRRLMLAASARRDNHRM